ncbi:helix-turn-helix domain-containing protein [Actinokineospora iranica]|uniref:Helix-turn-helix domain-containing protein n=1 Tax=Actinokineospora iranica TaxID=1271860 RepID=A0A1G6P7W0_9PSEU|nr:helix-turn-helix transcriptional regulator [Actinokineospora iranica]SDC76350.1 Helix-turn-helix domain-containing protein [Actinokineospora iranica]
MPAGPPSHRRVRLGLALRDARNAVGPRGMSQVDAAEQAGMSQPKLAKLENAHIVRIKMDDLNRLIALYGIDDAQAEELRRFARSPYSESGTFVETSPNAAWWQKHEEVERDARVINAVHLQAHDGLLQSEEYMRRQFELGGAVSVEPKIRTRLARQRAILMQDSPPDCTFILDQACLHTDMGDPIMMAAQLRHLLALSDLPHITILVKPFGAAFPAATYGWTFLKFDSVLMRDFVSVQYEVGAATIDDDEALRLFQTRWEQIRGAALSEVDTRKLIRRVLTDTVKKAKGL